MKRLVATFSSLLLVCSASTSYAGLCADLLNKARSYVGAVVGISTKDAGASKEVVNVAVEPLPAVTDPDVSVSRHHGILSSPKVNLAKGESKSFVGGQEGFLSGTLNGLEFAMITDMGSGNKYDHNEDSVAVGVSEQGESILMAVDGVGGNVSGEIASEAVLTAAMSALIDQKTVNEAVNAGRESLARLKTTEIENAEEDKKPAATLATVILSKNKLTAAHIGDAKILVFRKGQIVYESKDHSYVQELVDIQTIKPEAAFTNPLRNVVLKTVSMSKNHIGDQATVETFEVQPGDIIIVLSDGLLDVLRSREILAHVLRETTATGMALRLRAAGVEALQKFISQSLNGKGRDDNTTIIVGIVTE